MNLQSNNPVQVRLQSEIRRKYADSLFRSKRGECPEWPADKVIENERAARVRLALDLRDPASCHQSCKLFDELHAAILGRLGGDADRIVLANDIYNLVIAQPDSMSNQ